MRAQYKSDRSWIEAAALGDAMCVYRQEQLERLEEKLFCYTGRLGT
jgi:hypothetical protein